MKKSIYLILLLMSFGVYAQKEVFRIDSIPNEGVLLNKGWKYHAGDNPDFAKPDFNDSKWENIDPTQSILDLPQIQNANIGWFRFHINVDSSLNNEGLVLIVYQIGASEFFLNGKKIYKFGEISSNPFKVKAYVPWGKVIMLPLKKAEEQLLSIRFAYQKDIPYSNYIGTSEQNNCTLQIYICRANSVDSNKQKRHNEISHFLSIYKSGILAILMLLHLAFFIYYPKLKANLFFGIYSCFSSLSFAIGIFYYGGVNNLQYFYLSEIALLLNVLAVLCFVEAIYRLFKEKKGYLYAAIIFFGVISLLIIVSLFKWGVLATTIFSFSE